MRTEMDVLALGDYILLKEDQPAWPEGKGEGLENEDVTTGTREEHPEKLMQQLELLFVKEFWPAASAMRAKCWVRVKEERRNVPSTWEDANEPEDLKPVFELGRALVQEKPSPSQFAADLTKPWLNQQVAEVLQPVLARLIKAGLEHPVSVELQEQVSESVYVMF
jgi:hypothetical protein